MRPGPAPKPRAIRELEGNPSHRPLPNCPQPPAKLPKCPPHLSPEAKKIWRKLGPRFTALGVMADVDEAAFAILCESYAAWCQLIERAREAGPIVKINGQPQANPYLIRADKEAEKCRKLLAEFGGSPSSRTRLSVDGDTPADDLSAFLGQPNLRLAE